MSKFEPSDYDALNLSGDNYREWAMNTSIALKSRGLGKCIIEKMMKSKVERVEP